MTIAVKIATKLPVIFFCLCLFSLGSATSVQAQNASTYYPSQSGYLWYYRSTSLDSAGAPVTALATLRRDSSGAALANGSQTVQPIYSQTGSLTTGILSPLVDSSSVRFDGTTASQFFEGDIDNPLGLIFPSLTGFYSTLRFAQTVNSAYTVFTIDTTLTIDTISVPLRITLSGRRLADETVTVPFGTFAATKKFALTLGVSYILIPILPIPLFSLPDTLWIASGNWLVKEVRPTVAVNLSALGLPSVPIFGQEIVRIPPVVLAASSVTPRPASVYSLSQNYPNPFNPSTVIAYDLGTATDVSLKVFDVLGKEVATLVKGRQSAGNYSVTFNAAGLSSGVYFYRLQAGGIVQTKKMTVVR